ncbi:acyltransferase, partial [Nocardioides sp.]|uniref:acyltransferase family protein n=1 Tax=Nocardioides sp. TaxID=35761 RepID=UPI0031FEE773|nr:putative rane-bound acyltransferase [Nocardioides sp.]
MSFALREDPPERTATGRRDIQGLRAFAVLAVICDHLLQWPRGGFVGVDIFFVISGFLITGVLVREHENTDHISFVGFYRRRIKRILPASVLVLVVTVVASWLVFNQSRFKSTLTDSIWAMLFSANWHYAEQSMNYFDVGGPVSPLQHYWSLGVEEQFYFVWPWLMLAISVVLLHRSRSHAAARIVLGSVLAALSAGSFVWAMWQSSASPEIAYFSTLTRAWELGVGSLIAVAAPLAWRIPATVRPLLSWVGFGGMAASLWIVSSTKSFPAPWAALPVLATAIVILAGTFEDHRRQQVLFFPLTNRVSKYLGDISFSLYLWHFPIAILGVVLWGDSNRVIAALAVATVTISAYSYHLVEDPIRRSAWLENRSWRRRNDRLPVFDERVGRIALSGLVLAVAVLVGFAVQPSERPRSVAIDTSVQNAQVVSAEGDQTQLVAL